MFYVSIVYLTGTSDHYYSLIIILYGLLNIQLNEPDKQN